MSKAEIGCCGAYCGTCKAYKNPCKGCKIGYAQAERDINKAKCAIKVCCVKKEYISCVDCSKHPECHILNSFFEKCGYKYGKYKNAIEYIKENGYEAFLEIADKWKNATGKY